MLFMAQLSPEVAARLSHLKRDQIRDIFVPVLEKLYSYRREHEGVTLKELAQVLTPEELGREAGPTEVAAIWSVTNDTDVSSDHPRQLKRIRSIESSSSLGTVSFYRVRDIINREVSHTRGRKPIDPEKAKRRLEIEQRLEEKSEET